MLASRAWCGSIERMKRAVNLLMGVGILLAMVFAPALAHAAAGVLITAIQTGSSTNASAEMVRLSNASAAAIDINGWRLQYKAATGTNWTTRATLQGSLDGNASVLLVTANYVTPEPHQTMTDGLAAVGGHVQLIDVSGLQVDLVGWGTAAGVQSSPAPAPAAGQVLERYQTATGYAATGNNAADFGIDEADAAPVAGRDGAAGTPSVGLGNSGLTAPFITELLPNPATPQTDAKDEFVELYNPNATDFALSGLTLQTGTEFNRGYVFEAGDVVPAKAYKAFPVTQTKTTLANDSGNARLLDNDGNVLSASLAYDKADDGEAWALIDDTWQWTTTPTPGAANVATSTSTKPAGSNKSGVKAATGSKTGSKSAIVKAPSSTKKAVDNAKQAADQPADLQSAPSPIHPLVLAVVGAAALAYACYEYRRDLANKIHKLREAIRVRRAARQKL